MELFNEWTDRAQKENDRRRLCLVLPEPEMLRDLGTESPKKQMNDVRQGSPGGARLCMDGVLPSCFVAASQSGGLSTGADPPGCAF
jgi:hypothetical protein